MDSSANGDADTNGNAANGGTVAKKSRWDTTPSVAGEAAPAKRRSKWDVAAAAGSTSAVAGAPPVQAVSGFGTDISGRNAPLSDEELDEMLPSEGYKILEPPPGYEPTRAPVHRLAPAATPLPSGGFMNQESVDPRSLSWAATSAAESMVRQV